MKMTTGPISTKMTTSSEDVESESDQIDEHQGVYSKASIVHYFHPLKAGHFGEMLDKYGRQIWFLSTQVIELENMQIGR